MLISTEEDQISLPFKNGADSFTDINVVPEHEKDQLQQTISNLQGEIACLILKQRSFHEKRREILNKILDIKGCIRVFCRVRPFISIDKRKIHGPFLVESEKIVVRSCGSRKEFGFDKVFPQEASQDDVYVEVEPILRSALDGGNVCILAYGQTGTGKTFTMDGTNDSLGIVPRVLEELFHQASLDSTTSFTFSISMLEVYLGSLRDLLAPKPSRRAFTVSRCNLNIQTDPKGSVEIEGLTEVEISNNTKASWWYTKGRRARATSWTNVNEASSRSHCLTRITIYRLRGGKTEVSKLWMVDLGGSERLLKTGATGQTLDEGRAINLSLSALGDVIAALRKKRGHVPYRNSKLTQILRDSLGDKSKVLMLVHVSPHEEDLGETTCSFTFAKRARAVESNSELPEYSRKQKEKRLAELEDEMREAEEECQKVRSQIQNAEFLLSESRRLFTTNYLRIEDEEKTPFTPKDYVKTAEKAIARRVNAGSLPRFMKPTVASRERQNAAEKETDGRARSLRYGTRSSMHMSSSHSFGYSDPRFKAILRNPNKKSRYGEPNTSPAEDAKPLAMTRGKLVTSSDPNLRVTLCRHRRRMSDLI